MEASITGILKSYKEKRKRDCDFDSDIESKSNPNLKTNLDSHLDDSNSNLDDSNSTTKFVDSDIEDTKTKKEKKQS